MNEIIKVNFDDLFPLAESALKDGKTFSFCAQGVSMKPFIKGGKDLVTLGPVTEELHKNDVVFYRRKNGQYVLHRIIKIDQNNQITLCGDNQFKPEKEISSDQIFAKLIKINKNGKTVLPNGFSSRLWCFFLPARRLVLKILFPFKVYVKRLIKKSS